MSGELALTSDEFPLVVQPKGRRSQAGRVFMYMHDAVIMSADAFFRDRERASLFAFVNERELLLPPLLARCAFFFPSTPNCPLGRASFMFVMSAM